jgi:CubicO group peptidase (beta-lactamase class C family)
MYRFTSALLVLLGAGCIRAGEIDTGKIDALVEQAMKSWDVPGAAVVIVDAEKVLYLKGHGVREKGKPDPVTPDTLFPLASCSKAFTTTLMAMLVDDDQIGWNDPVRKHLKTFKLSDPNADGLVMLSDLVSHRTGVAPHDLLWYRAAWNQEEMIRRIGLVPLSKPFRTAMQYQSIMFTAAGHAVAHAAEKPWRELIQERIFDPLDMKSSSVTTTAAFKVKDRASGHRPRQEGEVVVPWYIQEAPNPAGSINSTARDLAPWLQLHLNLGKHGGAQLVSANNLAMTHAPHIVIPVTEQIAAEHPETECMSYALGWNVQGYRDQKLISHAGIIDGFRIHLTILPKQKIALGILCNLHATRMNLALSNNIVDLILDKPGKRDWNSHYHAIVDADAKMAEAREQRLKENRRKGTSPTLPLEKYVGAYDDPAYGRAQITLEKGELVWKWSNFRHKLERYHDDTFRIRDEILGDPLLKFQIEDDQVVSMNVIEVNFHHVAEKKEPNR